MKRIQIPATTANMGPGFDTLGMALKLYNVFEVEELREGIRLTDRGNPFSISEDENLIYKTILKTCEIYDYKLKGLALNVYESNVPLSRGLGSSATCIVGGIKAAEVIMGVVIPKETIINIATEIEGHPDNVVPATVGGMTVSVNVDGSVLYSKINIPDRLRFAVIVPELSVSTNAARKVLPDTYSRRDCIFNVSRAAMLVNALNCGELHKLRTATEDKLHQPYRKAFIHHIDDIFEKAESLGSYCEFISGSGSTMISVIDSENENFESCMKAHLAGFDSKFTLHILEPDLEGVVVI